MSILVPDTLRETVKKVSKLKEPDWGHRLPGKEWEKISPVIVKALGKLKDHGAEKPLATLQELAFVKSLEVESALKTKDKVVRALHTVALWLTDTRIYAEAYYADRDDEDAVAVLQRRGVLRQKTGRR